MSAPETAPPKVSAETIARMAAEIVGTPVAARDRAAVADMLQSLAADMAAVKRMNVGSTEPATVYDPAESDS
jgi:hypothetical protein